MSLCGWAFEDDGCEGKRKLDRYAAMKCKKDINLNDQFQAVTKLRNIAISLQTSGFVAAKLKKQKRTIQAYM